MPRAWQFLKRLSIKIKSAWYKVHKFIKYSDVMNELTNAKIYISAFFYIVENKSIEKQSSLFLYDIYEINTPHIITLYFHD